MNKINPAMKKWMTVLLSLLILASYVLLETLFYFKGEINHSLYRAIGKGGIGVLSLILAFLYSKKDGYSILKISVLLLFAIADVFINFYFPVGGGIFALGHLILLIYFLIKNKFDKYLFIIASVTFVIFLISNLIFVNRNGLLNTVAFCIYSVIISFLLGSVRKENWLLKIGVAVFLLSDLILMINIGIGVNLIIGHIARFVYYVSIVLLSMTQSEKKA